MNSLSLQSREFRRILVIRLSALGDVMNVIPLLAVLKSRYPQAELTVLTGPLTAGLMSDDSCVDRVITHQRNHNPWNWTKTAAALWREQFDLVVDLQSSRYSRWLAGSTRAAVRLGTRSGPFYTHRVKLDLTGKQTVELFRDILKPIGLHQAPLTKRFPQLDRCRESAAAILQSHGILEKPFAVLNPGHSPAWVTKRWPEEHWIRLGKTLVAQQIVPVVTGASSDKELADRIAEGIGPPGLSFAGKTDLNSLAGVLSLARVVISTDSGPMHMAAMVGVPVVALFGPTHPVTSGPFGDGHRVLHRRLPCSYCFKKECPTQHECLDLLSPAEVWNAVSDVLFTGDSQVMLPIVDPDSANRAA
ncbi:MAG: glycosyltransferase family 9 protein [Planctomycetota bacterium]|nr:glycosyltransferase family 9 protein [Planctomycetota bacterium]